MKSQEIVIIICIQLMIKGFNLKNYCSLRCTEENKYSVFQYSPKQTISLKRSVLIIFPYWLELYVVASFND